MQAHASINKCVSKPHARAQLTRVFVMYILHASREISEQLTMEKVKELPFSETIVQTKEAINHHNNEKVSKFIETILNERAKIKSKSQKTAFFCIILSSFFIFDLIPSLLPTLLFVSIEPFSHLYHAMIWPMLSKQQKTLFFVMRVCIRIPFIVKTTPVIMSFFQMIFWSVTNITITIQVVLFGWFLSSIIFFLLLPWSISKYLVKNGFYHQTFLHTHS